MQKNEQREKRRGEEPGVLPPGAKNQMVASIPRGSMLLAEHYLSIGNGQNQLPEARCPIRQNSTTSLMTDLPLLYVIHELEILRQEKLVKGRIQSVWGGNKWAVKFQHLITFSIHSYSLREIVWNLNCRWSGQSISGQSHDAQGNAHQPDPCLCTSWTFLVQVYSFHLAELGWSNFPAHRRVCFH